ncbi:4-hydroxyphenylacetate permease [Pseudomonas alkylphenolica]|uniref:4-hydroxyphenylacetate permease n=1 Tax=Pseudomonas alkylphenolica TaxID=237609 RepID=A0A443ZH61_9PSED|nr:MFS transporter [Pseudomonas alkylphenolica]RWU18216.1 4-hydroxyphenylacetate permease [Pseudomonas alkylphenolica]
MQSLDQAASQEVPGVTLPSSVSAEQVMSRVSRRLLGFLFLLFMFSFLDRINIGFAGAAMSRDLGLSAAAFGLANTVFYAVYIACGIPSNLMLERIGARRWIAVLVVAWGIASTCTMFARDETSLYVLRMLVGITEAGFLPGMLLYISRWFPSEYRSRANALFMIAMPVTATLGSIVSGFLLELNGTFGLHGWQWLFMVEGLPCVVLGMIAWYRLDDSPERARWLSTEEKQVLAALMARDREVATRNGGGVASGRWLTAGTMRLALIYFCMVTSMGMVNIWGPQMIAGFSAGAGNVVTGFLVAVPQVVTVFAMLWLGSHSDRLRERRWHTFAPLAIGAVGWLAAAFLHSPALQLLGISLASAGAFGAMTVFWAFADQNLSSSAKVVGIAFINAFGNAATIVSSLMVGILKDHTQSFVSGICYAAVLLAIGAVLVIRGAHVRRATLNA